MLNDHLDERAEYPYGRRDLTDEVSFYTITDERFFVGTVGMLNSLRLMGHEQRVVVLDCGLSERQRDLLGSECELVTLPEARATNPTLFKPYANLLRPRGLVVVLDSDLIITRPLDAVLEAASNGHICACADPESGRWFAEWEQLFELPCRPRRQTYVNAGFLAFSVEHWPILLPRWWDLCQRIWSYPTIYEGAIRDSPTSQRDQDALNAILMSEVSAKSLAILPPETQPDNMKTLRYDVELLDVDTLSCSLYGKLVTFIHFTGKTKPWEPRGWSWGGRHPYPALLRRLVAGRDVRVRVPRDEVPVLRFRPGLLGALAMRTLYIINGFSRSRERLRRWRFLRLAYKFLRGRLDGTRR